MLPSIGTDRYALIARRAVLVQRLEDGDRRIADARAEGADTEQWESFWLHLLDEYVDICRLLEGSAPVELDAAA